MIPGEEVTNGWGDKPLHVNSLCARAEARGWTAFDRADEGVAATLQEIRNQGGVPLVNHPNFQWSLTAEDIARGASGRYLLEVWSGHPNVNPMGDAMHPSAEAIWDELLARGADAIPVAVDDAHGLPDDPTGGNALPGRGWVETFGDVTSTGAICEALAAGHLYASERAGAHADRRPGRHVPRRDDGRGGESDISRRARGGPLPGAGRGCARDGRGARRPRNHLPPDRG